LERLDFAWRTQFQRCAKAGLGFALKGRGFQPRRKSLKMMRASAPEVAPEDSYQGTAFSRAATCCGVFGFSR
jgi:hypothetical protein